MDEQNRCEVCADDPWDLLCIECWERHPEAFELRRRHRVTTKRLSETPGPEGDRARRYLALRNANIAAGGPIGAHTLPGQMALFHPSSTLDEEAS